MTFLKNLRKSANWLVNKSSQGIHQLKNGNRWMIKQLGKAHSGYRSIKHNVEKAVPFTKAIFDAAENSEYGRMINQARKTAEGALDRVDNGLDTLENVAQKRKADFDDATNRLTKQAKKDVSRVTRSFVGN